MAEELETQQVRKFEDVAEEINNNFKILFEHSTDLVSFCNNNGETIWGNPALHNILGYSDDINPFDHVFEEDVPKVKQALKNLSKTGQPIKNLEYKYHSKNGDKVFNMSAYPTVLRGERLFVVISKDITEQKLTEQELINANKKLHSIVENMEDLFGVIEFVDDKPRVSVKNREWNVVNSLCTHSLIENLLEFLPQVLLTGKSRELTNFPISLKESAEGEKMRYYNFLIYKYNGGVAISGRRIYNTPTKLSQEMSSLIAYMDNQIQGSLKYGGC